MTYVSRVGLTAAHLFFFAASAGGAGAQEAPDGGQRGTVVASGQGEVMLAPDRADVSITVRTVAPEPDQAAERNLAAAEAVMGALEGPELGTDSIRSTGLRIGPNREYTPQGPRDAGYFAQRGIRVSTDDLADVGRIVEAAVGAGATQIDNIAYSSSRENEARSRALALAVERARADATTIARAAGGRLGPVVTLSTENVTIPRPMLRMDAAPQAEMVRAAVPEPEDLTVTAYVQGRWVFEPDS